MCATRQIEQGSDSSLHQKCLHFDTPTRFHTWPLLRSEQRKLRTALHLFLSWMLTNVQLVLNVLISMMSSTLRLRNTTITYKALQTHT